MPLEQSGKFFSAAARAGAAASLYPMGEQRPESKELYFTPANRNFTPPLSGDSLRAGLMTPLPVTHCTRHGVSPAGTGVGHLPGLFSSLEGHGRFTPTGCPGQVVVVN